MMFKKPFSVLLISSVMSSIAFASGNTHWGYDAKQGPDKWSTLSGDFAMCSQGENQSPINLTKMVEAQLSPLSFSYRSGGMDVVNNGHTIQVNYHNGSELTLAGHQYELKQFHFHAPSENTIEGHSYPLEGHLVHADKDGNLAVVAVMFKEGKANPALEKVWNAMPQKMFQETTLSQGVNAMALLPKDKTYYRFDGSLTTPPCSEGVAWLVMKHYATASKEQIEKFERVVGAPNNRPVQPINARVILE